MASSIALRRASSSSTLFSKLLRPSSVFRSFNTNAQLSNFGDDDRTVDNVHRRSDRSVSRRRDSSPGFFSDVFDPFSPPRSLNQMLNLMDQFMENPFLSGSPSSSTRRGWDVKEDDNTLLLRMDMPGISKDDVKISVQNNTLTIKGKAQAESENKESARRYSSRIDLPPSLYKVDEIKAEMKNGVLKLVVPKVKEELNKGFQVKVE
ncbi:hypothetical protein Dsin_004746 [Dipteronia sinensis]|uniref:SHSP domain-containing protein n=1 Tax=Dipteronia sinensis TaxID=43782 RepID=A0AAE0AWN4_9ROSI|nr:hypothetical protein Dsin_004746 [Dipteronia sinensis]